MFFVCVKFEGSKGADRFVCDGDKLLIITLENDKIIGQCKYGGNGLFFYCFSLYLGY